MDTIKTRLVTQARVAAVGTIPYKGILDCGLRVAREEGIGTLYRGLPPRLVSVVPMIGIQFGVYEYMKKIMQRRSAKKTTNFGPDPYPSEQILLESTMEVAASPEHPYPAPHFLKILRKNNEKTKLKK